jgi:DNA-binding NarL/FixJ family response regulator
MLIRVLVYDDNKLRQDALKLLIENQDDMAFVGAFENCSHVVDDIETLLPDVVLMDIDMPRVNGIEGLKLIRQHAPQVLIIMQTVFEDDEKIFKAIRAGAHGYFLKKTPPSKLIEGIRDVVEGGAPMTASVARKVLEVFHEQKGSNPFDLTPRELEILSMLMKGMSYKMIADACKVTFHTVNAHCKNIYEKLHVHSATEAVAKAIDQKII